MKTKMICGLLVGAAGLLVPGARAQAALIGFVGSPTTNSTDFNAYVTSNGGTINNNVNFDGLATGALNPSFYALTDGVTISATGGFSTVSNGAGPGQGNNITQPVSPGEGPHAPSNYLGPNRGTANAIFSFAAPVRAAGIFSLDYFNPSGNNPLTITAFTGQNGTGFNLGSFSSVAFNFQPNNLYFMGLASDTGNEIGSFVFTDVDGATGDSIGLDNLLFGSTSTTAPVPEPGTMSLMALGLSSLVGDARRRKKKDAELA